MKIKTSEIEGLALDWAVAGITHSEAWRHDRYEGGLLASMHGYSPSTDWSQGGPLIEGHEITIDPSRSGAWAAADGSGNWLEGPSPLIAACRAIVLAKMGEKVEIPDELL